MNVTLELTASPSLLEALRLLAGVIGGSSKFHMPDTMNTMATVDTPKPNAPKIIPENVAEAERAQNEVARNTTISTAGSAVAETATKTSGARITLEMARALTHSKSKVEGKRKEVKAILAKYDTDSVSNMDASNYEAYYRELEAL